MQFFMENKRAQIAIFVIVAIVIIAAAAFVLLRQPIQITPTQTGSEQYIEKCAEDAASNALDILSRQGGSVSVSDGILYENNKISYLCYTDEYYKGCINQQPVLKQYVEKEINDYVKPVIQKCVQDFIAKKESQGYSVSSGSLNIVTILQPKKVIVNVNIPITISKSETQKIDNFQGILAHPIYEQVMLSQEIVNSEASAGDFDQLTYMLEHPETSINKIRTGTATIYEIQDKKTGKQFTFAIRSYETPAGAW